MGVGIVVTLKFYIYIYIYIYVYMYIWLFPHCVYFGCLASHGTNFNDTPSPVA